MQISGRGILNAGQPRSRRAVSTFPAVTSIANGHLLATYRIASTKDSADATIELRRSSDGGRTWTAPVTPFETTIDGKRGSIRLCYITPLAGDHLLAAAMWVDRQAYPGKPLFNERTEGCLPMTILLADSFDLGATWTTWRVAPMPEYVGPPSLTSPLLRLANGRLAMSIETNKTYEDASPWLQRVVYLFSDDDGRTWGEPVTICHDPEGGIFHWDQRAAVCPDGRVVTFSWTYDRQMSRYLNVQRRFGDDRATSWTGPDDLGFADQPSHPAVLPDGRIVLAWVDRFQSHSIRARQASACDAPFLPETELVLFELESTARQDTMRDTDTVHDTDTGELLVEMNAWSYGLPYAEALADGDVLVVYYQGTPSVMSVHWVRIQC